MKIGYAIAANMAKILPEMSIGEIDEPEKNTFKNVWRTQE